MYSTVRPDKELAKQLVVRVAPEYLELFREAQRPHGWQDLGRILGTMRTRLKIDGYVALYESDTRLHSCFALGLFGVEETKRYAAHLQTLTPDGLRAEANSFAEGGEELADEMFPEDPEKLRQALATFEALPADSRAEVVKQAQYLCCAFIAFFYNTVSVMVHGEKLTSLVPKALDGDRQSFLKAIHVDKALLHAHPRFRERYEEASVNGEAEFLRSLAYRMGASPTKGKIRFPGLYLTFAMLEMLGWLDELRHEEIMDVCDAAGLDRWQNRIEDLNYLTKQLRSYRRMQALGGLSMH
jgi:hypothetical protein